MTQTFVGCPSGSGCGAGSLYRGNDFLLKTATARGALRLADLLNDVAEMMEEPHILAGDGSRALAAQKIVMAVAMGFGLNPADPLNVRTAAI